ncbi:MAG: hypothetical protein KAQ62_04825, partial [Cyclobacteriaceae bacterium]|nr:hypothetical protein [Cyclobacteriaceae bacterium]
DMDTAGYDVKSGMGLIHGEAAMKTFAAPVPTITELIVPEGTIPGEIPFNVKIKGENIAANAKVFMGEESEIELNTLSISNSQIIAEVPIFAEADQSIRAYNPPKVGTNGTDGGYSEPLYFIRLPKKKVIIKADDKTKKFGERLPDFSATILVDSIPIEESGLTLEDLGLDILTFSTPATSSSNVGVSNIFPDDITESLDPLLLELYEYDFVPGKLYTEKLAIKITPNDLEKTYGEKIVGITYRYDFDSENMDEGEIPAFIESLNQAYRSTFTDEDSLAIINRAKFLANRAKFLANTAWLTTDLVLRNRAKFLANGNVMIELDTAQLHEYQEYPEGPPIPTNRAKFLANGQLMADGNAYNANRAKFLANDNALVTGDDSTDVFSDIVVIVDTSDYSISKIYSINLITGLDVTEDSTHYIVPGAFIAPEAQNFDITYGMGNLTILLATLNVTVDDKQIVLGDALPEFTSTITGYKYEENDTIVFSSITYEPTEYDQAGTYAITPSFEFRDWINYEPDIVPGTLTVDFRANGRIAIAQYNASG